MREKRRARSEHPGPLLVRRLIRPSGPIPGQSLPRQAGPARRAWAGPGAKSCRQNRRQHRSRRGPASPAAPVGRSRERTGQTQTRPVERDEYLDALRRLQAEFDNYRKRVQRQQRDILENAAASLVKQLLPVLDTADLALAHGGGEDVKQVAGALFDILSKEGLERIDPQGQPFDPAHHDAVAHEPVEGQGAPEMPEVSEVLRAGYLWKGQVLRPAMVKVRG